MDHERPPRVMRRPGFSMAELVAVLAVMAVIGAVAIPQVLARIDDARSSALAQDMDAFGEALQAFRGNVGRYPSRLSHLTEQPPSGALDLCGNPIPDESLAEWRGPYLNRTVTSAGVDVGQIVIQDELQRDPADLSGGPVGKLLIDAEHVTEKVAERVERAFDGTVTDYTGGNVRWLTGSVENTLTFALPIRGC